MNQTCDDCTQIRRASGSVPSKNLPVKVALFDLYLKNFNFQKSAEFDLENAMFEYVGETIDYIALYDKKLPSGFALSNISETSTEITIAYIHDGPGDAVKEEELLWDLLGSGNRERIIDALKQTIITESNMSLIYVDGYEDYDGMELTKLLPMRRNFRLP